MIDFIKYGGEEIKAKICAYVATRTKNDSWITNLRKKLFDCETLVEAEKIM